MRSVCVAGWATENARSHSTVDGAGPVGRVREFKIFSPAAALRVILPIGTYLHTSAVPSFREDLLEILAGMVFIHEPGDRESGRWIGRTSQGRRYCEGAAGGLGNALLIGQ